MLIIYGNVTAKNLYIREKFEIGNRISELFMIHRQQPQFPPPFRRCVYLKMFHDSHSYSISKNVQHVRLELRPDNPEAGTPTSRPPFLLKKGRFDRNSRVDLLVKTVRNKKNITEKSRYKSLLPNVQSIFAAYSPSRVAGCAITIPPPTHHTSLNRNF